MPFLIRHETPQDAPAIRALLLAAFPGPLEAQLVDDLRAAGRLTFSFVAQLLDPNTSQPTGQIIGHIAFSPITIQNASVSNALGLAPLAVHPAHQKQGIGSQLVHHSLAIAKASGHPLIVLLGEPAYYARFGFTPARLHNLIDEYEGADAFQALQLNPHNLPKPATPQSPPAHLVKYAPEFAIFTP